MLVKLGCICALAVHVLAADANQFTNPDGTKDDFTQTFTVGSTLEAQWQSGWFGGGTRQNPVDLFVTGYKADSYVAVVARNISLDNPGSYKWRIDVPESAIKVDNAFVLRFTQARDPPNYSTTSPLGMSPSRGFRLQLASSSTSSKSATATVSSARSSSASATPTSASTSGSSSSTTKPKKKISLGAILGGVLGGLVALIGALVAVLMAIKKKKASQTVDAEKDQPREVHEAGAMEAAPSAVKYGHYDPVSQAIPQELEGAEVRHEADGGFAGHRPR